MPSADDLADPQALRREHARLQSLLHVNSDWLWEVDAAGRYTFTSDHARVLLGYPREAILGRTPFDFMPAEEARRVGRIFAEIMRRKAPFSGLLNRNLRADGGMVVLETSGVPLLAPDGTLLGYRGIDRDVTEREERIARIDHQARHDALTGLLNRPEFEARLEARLRGAGRGAGVALLLLDLDFFKEVNDQLGHATGDALLRTVAARIRGRLPPEGFAGRLGGDEFAVLLDGVPGLRMLRLARGIVADLCEPYEVEERRMVVGVSGGMALAPRHATERAGLMRCADVALYHAKHNGRGRLRLYGRLLDARLRADEALEQALREAIAQEGIELLYQPVLESGSRAVAGCVVQPCWRDERLRALPAGRLREMAERSGLILPLGALLLRRACADAAGWPAAWSVTVPATPVQLRDPNFLNTVRQALEEAGLAPQRLEIAITAAALPEGQLPRPLRKLRMLGVSLALAQCGEGEIALAPILEHRFERLRLSPARVRQAETEPSASLIQALGLLGRRLGLGLVAEGVETEAQLQAALLAGCDRVQGPYLAPPLTAAGLRQAGLTRAGPALAPPDPALPSPALPPPA